MFCFENINKILENFCKDGYIRVYYFVENFYVTDCPDLKINSNLYYVALAKKDNKFYIISKSNDSVMISGNLEKYLQTIDEHWGELMTKMLNEQGDYRNGYLQSYEFFFQIFTRGEMELTGQTIEKNYNTIPLNEKNSKYYYGL